uniref:LARP4 n=1 Tax=Macrostomum lignano TaxID=282301 RepID=A0A1I8H1T4_9PLAT
GPTILQQQQSEAHKPGSLKASVSTEGTTQLLPSETSGSPNSVGDSKRIPDKVETISDTATKVSELDGAWNGFYSSTSANLSELDCTESAAVRNQIAPRSSPQQDATIVDSTAVPAESTVCIQKLHQLQRLPADDEAAQSQPVPVLVRRQRRRRPRRTHPSLISGGTSGKPAATTAVASRPRKFSEAPPTTRRSGIGSGFSGDDESSRTQSASQKRRPCSGNVRYLASGVFETDV